MQEQMKVLKRICEMEQRTKSHSLEPFMTSDIIPK
jgi:hypothetical protein